jgi:hypothetical protein
MVRRSNCEIRRWIAREPCNAGACGDIFYAVDRRERTRGSKVFIDRKRLCQTDQGILVEDVRDRRWNGIALYTDRFCAFYRDFK